MKERPKERDKRTLKERVSSKLRLGAGVILLIGALSLLPEALLPEAAANNTSQVFLPLISKNSKPLPLCPGEPIAGYPVTIWVDEDLSRDCHWSDNYRGPCGEEEVLVDKFECEEADGGWRHLAKYRCEVYRWCRDRD